MKSIIPKNRIAPFGTISYRPINDIRDYYDARGLLTNRMFELIDETNKNMDTLFESPKHLTLLNCVSELYLPNYGIPDPQYLNPKVKKEEVDSLFSSISKSKSELLETIKELENLELKKQRLVTKY